MHDHLIKQRLQLRELIQDNRPKKHDENDEHQKE